MAAADPFVPDRAGPRLLHFASDRPVELAPASVAGGVPVEALPLVVSPGTVATFMGQAWALPAAGRYCFCEISRLVRNVIVFEGDVMTLLRALAQIHVHGFRHHGTVDELLAQACVDRLAVCCYEIVDVIIPLLRSLDVPARRVQLWTVGERTGTNDGHSLLEYFDRCQQQWVLADVDLHAVFSDGHGRRLSAFEVWQAALRDERPSLDRLTRLGTVDGPANAGDRWSISVGTELIYLDDDVLWANYRHLGGLLGLQTEDREADAFWGWFGFQAETEAERDLIMRYSDRYEVLEPQAWQERFYGDDNVK